MEEKSAAHCELLALLLERSLFLIYFNAKFFWDSHKPYCRMLMYLLLSLHIKITTRCFFLVAEHNWEKIGIDKFPWFPKK